LYNLRSSFCFSRDNSFVGLNVTYFPTLFHHLAEEGKKTACISAWDGITKHLCDTRGLAREQQESRRKWIEEIEILEAAEYSDNTKGRQWRKKNNGARPFALETEQMLCSFSPDDNQVADKVIEVLTPKDMRPTNKDTADDYDFIFAHFNGVDTAGHSYRFDPKDTHYMDSISTTDALIGKILTALSKRLAAKNGKEEWMVLTTTDHGGGAIWPNDHGDASPACKTVFIYTGFWPAIPSEHKDGSPFEVPKMRYVVDSARLIYSFLDVKVDSKWQLDQGVEITNGYFSWGNGSEWIWISAPPRS